MEFLAKKLPNELEIENVNIRMHVYALATQTAHSEQVLQLFQFKGTICNEFIFNELTGPIKRGSLKI
jgi:hypothetical protein